MNDVWIWYVVAFAGLSLSALFSGLETGAYCVDRVRLFVLAHSRDESPRTRRAVILRRELQNPGRMLAALLVSNNIANYLGSMGVAGVLESYGLSDWQSIVINAAVLTPMLFLFGETLPKDLFSAEADRLTMRLAPLFPTIRFLLNITLLLPIVRAIGALLERLVRVDSDSRISEARRKIANLMKEGARHGLLSETQTSLVDRAVAFQEVTVAEEMTPLSQASPIGNDWPRDQVLRTLQRAKGQWRPIVDRRRRIIGVVRTIDILRFPDTPIAQLMLKPPEILPDSPAPEALAQLREGRAHMGVVKQHGRTLGVLTIDDLIEPLTEVVEGEQA